MSLNCCICGKPLVDLGASYCSAECGREADKRIEQRQLQEWLSSDSTVKFLPKHRKEIRTSLLLYLTGVAQKTQGAEVWRSLFAEMRANEERANQV
jgi:hypothetical protein